jgi:predicted  nucleic acid-binding Zn-ribbon protein
MMMDDIIRQLILVQDKDERIANLQTIIESVPKDKERIAAELKGTEEQLNNAKTALQKLQSKINDIVTDIQSAEARITQLNTKSLDVKKNDEYRAIMNEITGIRKKISDKETDQLELMDSIPAVQEVMDQTVKDTASADKRIKAAQDDLDMRAKNCQAQIEKIQAERKELAVSVPDAEMRLYSRLTAQQRPGMPFRLGVVPIEDINCGSCHLSIPPDKRIKALAGKGVVTCGQCGAILYVDEN